MRTLLGVAVASLLMSIPVKAQRGGRGQQQAAAPPRPGIECFEQLTTPEYPQAALKERVDGSVWTTIQLSAQGAVDKVDTQVVSAFSEGARLLAPAVEKAVRASKFKSECAGKTVFVAFRYQEAGAAVPDPKVTSSKEPPNVVWIESQPPLETAAKSKPAAKSQH